MGLVLLILGDNEFDIFWVSLDFALGLYIHCFPAL